MWQIGINSLWPPLSQELNQRVGMETIQCLLEPPRGTSHSWLSEPNKRRSGPDSLFWFLVRGGDISSSRVTVPAGASRHSHLFHHH